MPPICTQPRRRQPHQPIKRFVSAMTARAEIGDLHQRSADFETLAVRRRACEIVAVVNPVAEAVLALGPEASSENPLTEGLERLPVHPTAMVIFGATGDLAHRKLLPALYNLAHEGSLPERFELIGVSRSEKSHEQFQAEMREAIAQYSRTPPNEEVLDALLENVRYCPGSFDDPQVYRAAAECVDAFDEDAAIAFHRVFYLS